LKLVPKHRQISRKLSDLVYILTHAYCYSTCIWLRKWSTCVEEKCCSKTCGIRNCVFMETFATLFTEFEQYRRYVFSPTCLA